MACFRPVKAYRCADGGVCFSELRRYDIVGELVLPCGRCLGCRLDRSRAWTVRCVHEAQLHKENCFITLTYATENLPSYGGLRYSDFQSFMRRLRLSIAPKPVRFFMCGEYGDIRSRPHYHACIFGHSFRDMVLWKRTESDSYIYSSVSLDELWPLGLASVGEFNARTAGYTARYCMKKVLGDFSRSVYEFLDPDTGEIIYAPSFVRMSLKPGIGAHWYKKFASDVFPHDYVVMEGSKVRVPRYYDKLLERFDAGTVIDDVKFSREITARKFADDNTAERLRVREIVKHAQVSALKRGSL